MRQQNQAEEATPYRTQPVINVYQNNQRESDFEPLNKNELLNVTHRHTLNNLHPSQNQYPQRKTLDIYKNHPNLQNQRQTEFFSSNQSSLRNISVNKHRYTVERVDEDRKTYYVKRSSSLFKEFNPERQSIQDKNALLWDNSSLEQTYSTKLSLRESKKDFKVFTVNEEYLSSKPRKIEVVFQNSRTETLPTKFFDKYRK